MERDERRSRNEVERIFLARENSLGFEGHTLSHLFDERLICPVACHGEPLVEGSKGEPPPKAIRDAFQIFNYLY